MSNNRTGYVHFINKKEGRGKRGPYTLYSMLMADMGTMKVRENEWISLGFKEPPFTKGDCIKIEVKEENGRVDYIDGTVKYNKKAPEYKPEQTNSTGGSKKAPTISELFGEIGGFHTEDDIKRISMNSAQADAINLLATLTANDALPITKAKSKDGVAKRYEEVMAILDKLTVRLFYDRATCRLLETVQDEAEFDTSAPEDQQLPENDSDFKDEFEDEGEWNTVDQGDSQDEFK